MTPLRTFDIDLTELARGHVVVTMVEDAVAAPVPDVVDMMHAAAEWAEQVILSLNPAEIEQAALDGQDLGDGSLTGDVIKLVAERVRQFGGMDAVH
jgi:hypothetical protein